MTRSAKILATIGLGAMLATGTATVSMARGGHGGGGGHHIMRGGHGFGHHGGFRGGFRGHGFRRGWGGWGGPWYGNYCAFPYPTTTGTPIARDPAAASSNQVPSIGDLVWTRRVLRYVGPN